MTFYVTQKIVQWPLFRRSGCMHILSILLLRTDDTGRINTSRENIASITGLSIITISAILRDLAATNIISQDEGGSMWLTSLPDGIQSGKETKSKQTRKQENDPKAEAAPEAKDNRFVKPSQEEVAAYITLKGYHFSAEEFVAHYESNGWKVGKNPMKKWQAACVTFERTWKKDQERYQQRLNSHNHAQLNNYQQQQLAARQAFANAAAQTNVCSAAADSLLLPGVQ